MCDWGTGSHVQIRMVDRGLVMGWRREGGGCGQKRGGGGGFDALGVDRHANHLARNLVTPSHLPSGATLKRVRRERGQGESAGREGERDSHRGRLQEDAVGLGLAVNGKHFMTSLSYQPSAPLILPLTSPSPILVPPSRNRTAAARPLPALNTSPPFARRTRPSLCPVRNNSRRLLGPSTAAQRTQVYAPRSHEPVGWLLGGVYPAPNDVRPTPANLGHERPLASCVSNPDLSRQIQYSFSRSHKLTKYARLHDITPPPSPQTRFLPALSWSVPRPATQRLSCRSSPTLRPCSCRSPVLIRGSC
ncbi:hypothetical protein PYCCODRAFT_601475 [Trametes coccinea BRFM310]|uniref:Uncharacterized protein n=1 Tax=Trametes coccinea (strain BRFM310) TaxID=1353009 RepID=A0A1Y2J3G1_TRAC3|nr:hypothetical protein PYCCODRAFT_601475 [Trametes coccinea BRFM310]